MKILVCVKQVPDMESKFHANAEADWYDETDLAFRMNEYDEYAVEQAVLVKEAENADTDVTVLSIGPERAVEAIKKALAMGCDRGVHINDENYYKKDPFAIASIISSFARDKQFDLIFTGMQSQDRGSGQVGVLIAETLVLPSVTTVVDFVYDTGTIKARRELEGGLKAVVEIKTPCIVTCQLGLNTPRYPTLPNIMKAKKKELLTVGVEEFSDVKNLASAEKMYCPEKKGGGLILEGDTPDLLEKLIEILGEKTSALK